MCAAARVLALSVGLTQLWLANCKIYSSIFTGLHEYTTEKAVSPCDELSIVIEKLYHWGSNRYSSDRHNRNISVPHEYGPLNVKCCGGNAERLRMIQDGAKLQTTSLDWGTIEWNIGAGLQLGNSKYVCIDDETECEAWASISVKPAIRVIIPGYDESHTIIYDSLNRSYVFEYGKSMSVLCTGPAKAQLTMTRDGEELETTKVVNEADATINWFVRKPDLQIAQYACLEASTNISNSVEITVMPFMSVKLQNENIKQEYSLDYRHQIAFGLTYTYGDTIEIICTGPRAVKIEGALHKELLTEKVNETTVKSLITISKIGVSSISCIDSEISEYTSTFPIRAKPRLEVISQGIRRINDEYYMKHGESMEIICSGSNASELTINRDFGMESLELNHTVVNGTAIKWYLKKNTHPLDRYVCNPGDLETEVSVLAFPKALNFRCVLYNLQYVNCSWTSLGLSRYINYTLFHMEDESSVHICTKLYSIGKESCVSNYQKDTTVFSFLMQSCSEFVGCYNETFVFDHTSIIKADPPYDLSVILVTISSPFVVFKWHSNNAACSAGDFQYIVEYWYSDTEPVQVNSSNVTRDFLCYVKLELPCPGQFYTFRVYQKFKQAVGEEYWSEPSSVSFHYKPGSYDTDIDSTCDLEAKETKEVLLHSIYKLNNEVVLKMRKLKKKMRTLKDKSARIRAYSEQQRRTDEL